MMEVYIRNHPGEFVLIEDLGEVGDEEQIGLSIDARGSNLYNASVK
jgi:hypothetical protein